jgi:hypothetical protein
MLWTKARDGTKDIYAHFFGESDPKKMDWVHLHEVAHRKISDSACKSCHNNLIPKGVPLKTIIAHRAYIRMEGRKRCVDCHSIKFHGAYEEYLFANNRNGGEQ